MAATRHRNMPRRGGRKAFVKDKGLAHTQKGRGKNVRKKPIFINLNKRI